MADSVARDRPGPRAEDPRSRGGEPGLHEKDGALPRVTRLPLLSAVTLLIGTAAPVWSALSCGNLERLWVPDTVTCIRLYADNDADSEFEGQACAYALARRLKKERRAGGTRHVEVYVPRRAGTDYADVWLRRLSKATPLAA